MIMNKTIANDFVSAVRSKGAKLYLIGTLALILLANIAVICFRFIYGSNEGTFSYNVFEYASWCFLIPYYSCILIGMIVLCSGTKPGREKPLKPAVFYLSKLITAILLAALFLVAAFVLLYVITTLFHINEGLILWGIVKSFLQKAALALPLWFAGISFAMLFLHVCDKRWKAVLGFVIVTVIIPQIIRILSLDSFKFEWARTIRKYTITQSFGLLPYPAYPERSPALIVTLGFVYGIIATVVGIVLYARKQRRADER